MYKVSISKPTKLFVYKGWSSMKRKIRLFTGIILLIGVLLVSLMNYKSSHIAIYVIASLPFIIKGICPEGISTQVIISDEIKYVYPNGGTFNISIAKEQWCGCDC